MVASIPVLALVTGGQSHSFADADKFSRPLAVSKSPVLQELKIPWRGANAVNVKAIFYFPEARY